MDNRQSQYDLPATVLRDAANVDVMKSGKLRRRRGISQAVASAGAHSAFADSNYMYWATATTLNRAGVNLSSSVLHTDVGFGLPVSYVSVNGDVFFSNENINGKVTASGYEPWGVQAPTTAPTLTPQPAGDIVHREVHAV
jgi:hypothetical protein